MLVVEVSSLEGDAFEISVDGGFNREWKIRRTFGEFQALKALLEQNHPSLENFQLQENDSFNLQAFLEEVIKVFGDRLWRTQPLLLFLDNVAERSFIVEMQMTFLAEQVDTLMKKTGEIEALQKKMYADQTEMAAAVKTLQENPRGAIKRFSARFSNVPAVSSPNIDDLNNSTTLALPTNYEEPHHRMSIISNVTTDSLINETGLNADSGDENSANRSPSESFKSRISGDTDRPNSLSSRPVLPKSPFIDEDLLPLGDKNQVYESTIDSLLETIGPTEQQIQHRQSIVALLRRLVRVCLGGSVFEVGITASCCILPDDPVRLMVTLPKNVLPTWHTQLCEYLTGFSEKANAYGGSSFAPPDEDENLDPYFNESTPLKNHFLGNISHMKQNLNHIVQLVVDSIPIEIAANNRTDLCMFGFFEEISNLVNSDQLFKRSYLLIRAWWCYETPAFVGCVIRHYLTDYQLFVMVAAVFNLYSQLISHPFQALCMFLLEYSTYDGSNQAITLYGITSFATRSSNQPVLPEIQMYHLFKQDLLDKYWHIFNVAIVQDQEVGHQNKRRSVSSEDPVDTEGKAETTDTEEVEKQIEKNQILETLRNFSATNLQFFDRSSFNIVHPLTHTNMVTEKLSQRRVSRLSRAFQIGATNLAFFLKRAAEDSTNTTPESTDNIKTYFPNVNSYPNPWVKQQKDIPIIEVFRYVLSTEKIEQDISYSDLMIEAIVTDQALQVLAMEILAMKGPLPVGEIGKVLAEMTSIPSLSLRLKEKYGGLKKFLEQYPASFVVSNDHPFNPNVLLKCSLSQEHLDLLDKGIFPHQLLVKAKKSASASKKKKSHSIPSYPGQVESRNHEYLPYAQTPHTPIAQPPAAPVVNSRAMAMNGMNQQKMVNTPYRTAALPPSIRRSSIPVNKAVTNYNTMSSASPNNVYQTGIAASNDQNYYHSSSQEDFHFNNSQSDVTSKPSLDYSQATMMHNFTPSPNTSERNSFIHYSLSSPSLADEQQYHSQIASTQSTDAYSNPFLSQLRAESLEIPANQPGNVYYNDYQTRAIGGISGGGEGSPSNLYYPPSQATNQSNSANSAYSSLYNPNPNKSTVNNDLRYSQLAGLGMNGGVNNINSNRMMNNRQAAGTFTSVNSSNAPGLFGDSNANNSMQSSYSNSSPVGTKERNGSVLSSLFPSLISTDANSNAYLGPTSPKGEDNLRGYQNTKYY